MNNILLRSLTGGIYIALLILSVVWNAKIMFLVFGLINYQALKEYNLMMNAKNWSLSPFFTPILGSIVFLVISMDLLKAFEFSFGLSIFLSPLLLITTLILSLFQKENGLIKGATGLLGIIYITIPLALSFLLIELNDDYSIKHFYPILGMLFITWTADTFAYLSGRFFGKNKLFERISPKKTWEGVYGGILFSIICGLIFYYFEGDHLMFWILASIFLPISGILGDLFESLIKRTIGVKDSGNLIPGHGGILDRIDAMLFNIPLTLFILYCTY